MSDSQPSLNKDKMIDHFRFHWTESSVNPDDNVTEADIDATGDVLNWLYDKYSAELRAPQAEDVNGMQVIDVEVYFDAGLYGSTSSFGNKIFLNSRDVVRDNCRRRTTSAHELFHRVQYSYGYVTGTANQRWWVEALGSWSQKYAYPTEHDYLRRVVAGFNSPKRNLLSRSYDACHYWKYVGERLVANNSFQHEFEAIRNFMELHDSNGNDAPAACATLCQQLHSSRSFDNAFVEWAMANFAKDYLGSPYGYNDNLVQITNCSRPFGPFPTLNVDTNANIDTANSNWSSSEATVPQNGSNYHVISFGPVGAQKFDLKFEANSDGGGSEFAISVVKTKQDDWRNSINKFLSVDHTEELAPSSEDFDQVCVVVSSLSAGNGNYRIAVSPRQVA